VIEKFFRLFTGRQTRGVTTNKEPPAEGDNHTEETVGYQAAQQPNEPLMFRVNVSQLQRSVLNRAQRLYGLSLEEEGEDERYLCGQLSEADRRQLELDLRFYSLHPWLPTENVFASLRNYDPKNESQEEALLLARRILEASENIEEAIGAYFWGTPGIGKSHLSVAIAKELFAQGQRVLFITHNGLKENMRWGSELHKYDIIVVDDFNNGWGLPGQAFVDIITHMHDQGGIVVMTSNVPLDTVMDQILATRREDSQRISDRMGTYTVLQIEGATHREKPHGLI
jgi:DNA replication protein DnaC